jgi:hypothetical protein
MPTGVFQELDAELLIQVVRLGIEERVDEAAAAVPRNGFEVDQNVAEQSFSAGIKG